MTRSERELYKKMMGRVNSYENNADDAPIAPPSKDLELGAQKGNPQFKAQFDVQVLLKYFSVAAGVYTAVAAGALPAALQQKLAMFLFGKSDFASGYTRIKQAFPLTNWNYDAPLVYGKDPYPAINGVVLDATAKAVLAGGDVVITAYATSGGTNYVAMVIIRCTQVSYATLLDSLSSDRFQINNVRYKIDTTTYGENQFNNNIYITKQSLFGKFDSDFVSPDSYKKPEQYQQGIIDVPVETGVDKQRAVGTYCEYNTVVFKWSIFVRSFDKLQA